MHEREFLTVHHRDPKSGRTVNVTPYKLIIDKEKGSFYLRDGQKYGLDFKPIAEPKAEKVASKPFPHNKAD
jgi:hypothetical protein